LYGLLRRNFRIEEIQLVRPDINLLQKDDGTWNLPITSSDNGAGSSKEAMMLPFIADNVQIIDGNLTWAKVGETTSLSIQNFTIRLKIHSINSFPNMDLNLSVGEMDSTMISPIKDIKANLKTSEGLASLDNLSLNISGGSIEMKGDSTLPSKDKDAEYTATISVKNIDLETLISQFVPEAKELLKGVVDADITIKGQGFDAKADIKFSIPSLLVQDKIKIEQVKGNINYADFDFIISDITMNVFGGNVVGKGTGTLANISNPEFNLAFNVNNIDTGIALTALGQDALLAQGKLSGNINASGNISDIKADGKISSDKLNIKKMGDLTDITAPFRATITKQDKEVNIDNFSAKIYGGSVEGKANIIFGKDGQPHFSTTLNLSGLEAGNALKQLAGKAFLTGKTEGNIQLAGQGTDINTLTGSTDIIFKNGKLATHPIQNLLSVFIPALKTINFVAAKFLSTIGDGKVNITTATLENPQLLMYYGKGQMKLSNQKLAIPSHLLMRCDMVAKMPLVSGAFVREDENWCGIDFNILGTLSNPKSDLGDKLKGQAIGSAIEQIFGGDKDKEDKGGGGIGDLLEGIFK
ncbi:MAG: AsmA family protein, partial [Candidatus Omnitrophica bacterium]|nr:AsmA family protein [Candidatus Omnitrophota bacterium]